MSIDEISKPRKTSVPDIYKSADEYSQLINLEVPGRVKTNVYRGTDLEGVTKNYHLSDSVMPILFAIDNSLSNLENLNGFSNTTTVESTIPVEWVFCLYINPDDLKFSSSYIQSIVPVRGTIGSQYRHVRHVWGQDQIKMSASGKTGAFYTEKYGLTRLNNSSSASYQNLMTLIRIYRNNGCTYIPGTSIVNHISTIRIIYDGYNYSGSFDSFSISETEENPFNLSYSFEFTIRSVVDVMSSNSIIRPNTENNIFGDSVFSNPESSSVTLNTRGSSGGVIS